MADDVTRGRLIKGGIEKLERASFSEPRRNVEWLLCDVLGCSRAELYMRPDEVVRPQDAMRFESLLQRRLRHEPLQYIIGYTDFYRLRVRVTPHVLIPRPETEQVVEEALVRMKDIAEPHVLDLGTGSGCIALAVKHERPDSSVWACDVSSEALDVARSNASVHALEVEFFEADVMSPGFLEKAPGPLDLIISNPPYVPDEERAKLAPEVRDFEPEVALFAGRDPLAFYHQIGRLGRDLLKPHGWIVFETHAESGSVAQDALIAAGYRDVHLERDYAGYPRILRGRRSE